MPPRLVLCLTGDQVLAEFKPLTVIWIDLERAIDGLQCVGNAGLDGQCGGKSNPRLDIAGRGFDSQPELLLGAACVAIARVQDAEPILGQGKVGIDLYSLFERGSFALNIVEVVQD